MGRIDLPEAECITPVRNIIFQNTNEGWLTVDKSSIFYTEDGGVNWEEKGDNVEGGIPLLLSFQAVTDSILYFYGFWNIFADNNGRIWKTTDKGESWSLLDIQLPTTDMNLFFLNEMTGWVGCQNNTICKTTDGGETWLEYPLIDNLENYIFSMSFANDSMGWAGGWILDSPDFHNCFIAYSGDGGQTWSRQQLDVDTSNTLNYQNVNRIIELQMINDTLGYAISEIGRIYRYRGRAADCGPVPVLVGANHLSPRFSWPACRRLLRRVLHPNWQQPGRGRPPAPYGCRARHLFPGSGTSA